MGRARFRLRPPGDNFDEYARAGHAPARQRRETTYGRMLAVNRHLIEELASQERFERAKPPPPECAHADPAGPVRSLLRRHCAGLHRPPAEDMRRYLLGPPAERAVKSLVDWAAYSLLGKSSAWDLLDLIGPAQIPISRIAAHVRALGVTSQLVIRFLNQLAPR